MRRFLPQAIVVLLLPAVGVFAQLPSGRAPDGETVVRNVEKTYAGINDYTVTMDVTVDLERLTVPPMHAVMYFKQPDKVHFETESFAMLPREAAAMNFARLRERYAIDSRTEREQRDGAEKLKVTLIPKNDRTGLKRVLLYVDPARWTADRVVSPAPEGRTMTVVLSYEQVEGRWLPSLLVLTFSYAPGDSLDPGLMEQMSPISPTRRPQLPRDGTVTIRYSNYKINSGLSDDLFAPDSAAEKDKEKR